MTDWQQTATTIIASHAGDFTGEDIRLACRERGAVAHHPNAWGAYVRDLLRDGVIERTGEFRAMRDTTSHGRETRVYRRKALDGE